MTNPNGSNQYIMDPRQKLCWDLYVNPKSETFGNGMQSAIKAGYEEAYANQITTTEWFKEKIRRLNMLGKAEKVLDNTLTYEPINEEGKIDTALLRVQTDVAKHITSTLGKHEGYSTRTETDITSKGERINITSEVQEIADKFEEELKKSLE